jgi:hyaluronoglucosaminidase
LNTFVYAPKNDPYHRNRWRDPYPADTLADMRATAVVAGKAKVRFIYAIAPGLDVCYACRDDFAALTAKLRQVSRARVRHFAIFFDDVAGGLTHPEDVSRYGGNDAPALARAHADLVNRVDRWLRRRRLPGIVFMVPTDYAGNDCDPYLTELGMRLRKSIAVGWTGSGVFAATVTGAEAAARRACVGDHAVVLWDNFPVNDTVLSSNLHLGPLTGRDAALARTLGGHLLNPMTQAHASLVALGGAAAYFRDPDGYDAEAAWHATLAELDPGGGLAILADQVRSSSLDLDDARALAAAVDGVAASYAGADWDDAMNVLQGELARQTSAPVLIEQHLGGTPLATEIAPWVAELQAHVGTEGDAVRLLQAMKPDFEEVESEVVASMLHVRGFAVGPDPATVEGFGPTFATPPAPPDFGALLVCMGDLLGADITFCPQFGLNVHGKAIYVYPRTLTDLEVVTGRNVHDHFLAFVANRYADYVSRQGPGADVLSVTLDGAPLALDAQSHFETTIPLPASGHARLVVTTAAGDATSFVVP